MNSKNVVQTAVEGLSGAGSGQERYANPHPAAAFRRYRDYEIGAPDRIRTCDPKLRRLVLYPTELRARIGF